MVFRDSHPKNFQYLIKQNQKLASDFILKQSKTMSSAQSPACKVSRVQSPGSSVQSPESSVQSPASNTCVQSPGIPVCPLVFLKMFFVRISDYAFQYFDQTNIFPPWKIHFIPLWKTLYLYFQIYRFMSVQ